MFSGKGLRRSPAAQPVCILHEDGYECHTFDKSGKKNGDGQNLTERGGVAAGGFSGFHADAADADTGTEHGKTCLESGQIYGSCGVCDLCDVHGIDVMFVVIVFCLPSRLYCMIRRGGKGALQCILISEQFLLLHLHRHPVGS